MSLLTDLGILLGAYLAAGRVGLVAACFFTGCSAWQTMTTAILVDFFQIPVYGLLMETTGKHTRIPMRLRKWMEHRTVKLRQWMTSGRLVKHMHLSGPMMIVAVAFLPLRGFGIFSACILAFLMKYDRVPATLFIMAGSLMGATLLVLLFFLPAKVYHGF